MVVNGLHDLRDAENLAICSIHIYVHADLLGHSQRASSVEYHFVYTRTLNIIPFIPYGMLHINR